ncbi:uncharacterized protein PHALS_14758 [Plasmopara halstedii]|uniref:Uncharacterized protein n=1 Tax=Plasmopara halstedii TaxID=4781 RepID=A0A0P1AQU6_PLAHL|nr:uncharacterized protein PHALS_14758 [Plasmopara halstedii]CEG43933.1 hypothetical protein PHALS_14758 [Plasmopara halstedii]|eukprot:XP_024580302.1 hypothetical protein PHALS_14758 [Plasmopara halstedii]
MGFPQSQNIFIPVHPIIVEYGGNYIFALDFTSICNTVACLLLEHGTAAADIQVRLKRISACDCLALGRQLEILQIRQ